MKTRAPIFLRKPAVHAWRGAARGFTLIELMVTIAVAAVLMTIAVPNFREFQRNSELTSLTNTLLAAVNTARSEAMKNNLSALVEARDGATWTSGWRVYVDRNMNKTYEGGTDTLVLEQDALPDYIAVSGTGIAGGSTPHLIFNASGYAGSGSTFSNATISLSRKDASGDRYTRRLKIARSGRARTCRPDTAPTGTCSASD